MPEVTVKNIDQTHWIRPSGSVITTKSVVKGSVSRLDGMLIRWDIKRVVTIYFLGIPVFRYHRIISMPEIETL